MMYNSVVDVACRECGRDDRLSRVVFTATQMRATCQCGHAFVVEIALGQSLDIACDVLEKNPLVAVGQREE